MNQTNLTARLVAPVAGLALLSAGSIVLLISAGRAWISGTVTEPGSPVIHVSLSGHTVTGAATAFGLLGLAGAATALLVRGWARRLLASVLTIGLIAGSALVAAATSNADSKVRDSASVATGVTHVTISIWPAVAFGAIVLATVGAAQLAFARTTSPRKGGAPVAGPPDLWSAIDRGEDPTG